MNAKSLTWRSRESRHAAARLDVPTADRIPYSAHVTASIVRTWNGDYLQTFRLAGASFESADDVALNAWHQRLNVLWRNLAAPEVALWSHVIRRRETAYPPGKFPPGFAADLNARSRSHLRRSSKERRAFGRDHCPHS